LINQRFYQSHFNRNLEQRNYEFIVDKNVLNLGNLRLLNKEEFVDKEESNWKLNSSKFKA